MLKDTFIRVIFLLTISISAIGQPSAGQAGRNSATLQQDEPFTLTECLRYALKNQPVIKQSGIDEAIARKNNEIAFSSWLPQVGGTAGFSHYFQLPTAFSNTNGTVMDIKSGVNNTVIPAIGATQTIFSPDVLMAVRAAKLNILNAKASTQAAKIDVVAGVSKAFYNLLLAMQQVDVYKEDTARLGKNLADAYNRYVSGIVDKVDYKQATIALNNSRSQLKTAAEAIGARKAALVQQMGYPADKELSVKYDTTRMMQDAFTDTLAILQFEKRIEYQQLQLAKRILRESTLYYQLGFTPSLSAFYNYNYEFASNSYSDLFSKAYPNSLFGLQLNIPLFTGLRRVENIKKAKLLQERIDWDEVNLKLAIYAQYRQALAGYKSNFFFLRAQRDNVEMAREVYDIVKLQYHEGVKTYLDVIIAEADLQTSEINYLNALFQLLESKIDLEQAMGDIPTEI